MKNLDKMLGKIGLITKGMAQRFAEEIAEIEREQIKRNVYDYYDNIRAGALVGSPYPRTYELINSVKVYGKSDGTYEIVNEAHNEDILNYIEGGVAQWKNSILYRAGITRKFIEPTIEEANKLTDKFIAEAFKGTGLKIQKRR